MKYEQTFNVNFSTLIHHADVELHQACIKVSHSTDINSFEMFDELDDVLNSVRFNVFISYTKHECDDGSYYVVLNRNTPQEQLLSCVLADKSEVKYDLVYRDVKMYKPRGGIKNNVVMIPGDGLPRSVAISLMSLVQAIISKYDYKINVSITCNQFTVST